MRDPAHPPARINASSSCLLIVLSGTPQRFQERLTTEYLSVTTLVVEEKSIASFWTMRRLLRQNRVDTAVFGCKDLSLQRYLFVLKGYLLLAKASSRLILDEEGKFVRFNLLTYLMVDAPKFIFEIFASGGVLVITIFRLMVLRYTIRKNR
ncbi:MAG: hypothetical protein ACRDGA_03625 [Bacteroidota bacterium]